MKHTPGPWEVSEEWHGDVYIDSEALGEGSIAIAKLINPEPGDAALIAAAPELLGAAKETLAQLEEWEEMNQPDEGPEWYHVTKLREAINKATGGEK